MNKTIIVENKSAHCKVYLEPSLKETIQNFAKNNRMTFSEAGRELWLIALELVKPTLTQTEEIGDK